MKPIQLKNSRCKLLTRYITALVALVILSATIGPLCAIELTRVRLAAATRVDADKIFLGHIATIEGSDSQEIAKLSDIVVGRSPLPGNSRTIDSGAIKTRLKQNGFDLAKLVLDLPPSITVTRSFIEVSREKIKGLVADYIAQNVTSGHLNARIKQIQVPASMRLPVGRITYTVSPPAIARWWGRMSP